MQKRYYKAKEKVWVVKDKAVGVVQSINKETKEVVVAIVKDENTTILKKYKLWEIDKLKEKAKPTFTKDKTKLFFSRIEEDVIPISKREEDAGYDIYAHIPEHNGVRNLYLPKGKATMVSTKLAFAVTKDFAISLQHERGSVGTLGTTVTAGLIDSGYRNEVFVSVVPIDKSILITDEVESVTHTRVEGFVPPTHQHLLTNSVDEELILYPYSKAIAQAVLIPVIKAEVVEIPYEELKAIASERGMGKLGSSKK